jgi:hypothetical protein
LNEKASARLNRFSEDDQFELLERSDDLGSCVTALTGTLGGSKRALQSLPYIAFKEAT